MRTHSQSLEGLLYCIVSKQLGLNTAWGSKSTLFTPRKDTHTHSRGAWRQFGCWRGSPLGLQATEIQFLLWGWNSSVSHHVLSWRLIYLFLHPRFQTLSNIRLSLHFVEHCWFIFFIIECYPSFKTKKNCVHPVHTHHKCWAPAGGHESSQVKFIFLSPLGEILLLHPRQYSNTIKPQEQ